MKYNLENYPKNGSGWEKNVWEAHFEAELREKEVGRYVTQQDVLDFIKEILGDK